MKHNVVSVVLFILNQFVLRFVIICVIIHPVSQVVFCTFFHFVSLVFDVFFAFISNRFCIIELRLALIIPSCFNALSFIFCLFLFFSEGLITFIFPIFLISVA